MRLIELVLTKPSGQEVIKSENMIYIFSYLILVLVRWALYTRNEGLIQVLMLPFLRHSTNKNKVFFITKQLSHQVLGDTVYISFHSM